MPQFELDNSRVSAPEKLFPIVKYFDTNNLVAIYDSPWVADRVAVQNYHHALRAAFPNARFVEFSVAPKDGDVPPRLKALKAAAREENVLTFLLYRGSSNRFIDQVADYTFKLHEGWVGVLVELGKSSRAEPLERTHAVIFS